MYSNIKITILKVNKLIRNNGHFFYKYYIIILWNILDHQTSHAGPEIRFGRLQQHLAERSFNIPEGQSSMIHSSDLR